jgi:hypothetical protein
MSRHLSGTLQIPLISLRVCMCISPIVDRKRPVNCIPHLTARQRLGNTFPTQRINATVENCSTRVSVGLSMYPPIVPK